MFGLFTYKGLFYNAASRVSDTFGLSTLQADTNCVLIQDPSAIWGGSDHLPRRNLLLATDTLATQNVTVTAEAHTLYLQGTGSVTLSGTGSGTLQGTGANDRVSLAFTPTAGTLTLTVSGTVTFGMLCKSSVTDRSYQKITDWVTEQYAWAATRNVPWLRRNRFLSTATLSTQTVSSVTATPLTVSFTGTGTITFSTAYSGSLVGTGANDRVTATFTPAAGNLVCTVTGSVTLAQCEVGSTATTYQEVGASWAATYTSLAIAAGYPISLYSDRAGTTATYGPDDPVGVLLDQSEGLVGAPAVQRNILSYSQGFTTSPWTINGATPTATTATAAPDGTLTAFELNEGTGVSAYHTVNHGNDLSLLTIGTTYKLSVYVKYVDRQYFGVSIFAKPDAYSTAVFDILNGTYSTSKSEGTGWTFTETPTISSVGDSWYRVSMSITIGSAGSGTYRYVNLYLADASTLSTNDYGLRKYTGTSKKAYIWGAQITLSTTTDQSYQKTTSSWLDANIPGYHATAPGDAQRPVLRLDGNGKFYLYRDATDDALAITWPENYTTIAAQYVADQTTTTETTGITLNGATSYNTPQHPTGDYGRIIFKTPTPNAAKVQKYLDNKAGR